MSRSDSGKRCAIADCRTGPTGLHSTGMCALRRTRAREAPPPRLSEPDSDHREEPNSRTAKASRCNSDVQRIAHLRRMLNDLRREYRAAKAHAHDLADAIVDLELMIAREILARESRRKAAFGSPNGRLAAARSKPHDPASHDDSPRSTGAGTPAHGKRNAHL